MAFRKNPKVEDGSEPWGRVPVLRPHSLTQELLDWALAALEAVISTPELQSLADARSKQSLLDAYKQLDRLYPLTAEVRRDAMLWELENRDTGAHTVSQQRAPQRVNLVPRDGALEGTAPDAGQDPDSGMPSLW